MDPTEIYQRFEQLAAEFGGPGGIAELIDLPYKTNGYQRKSQAIMSLPRKLGDRRAANWKLFSKSSRKILS